MELSTPHPAPRDAIGAPSAVAASAPGQFITCTLDAAEYGVDIMAVREIKGWSDTTAIPHAPAWIRGVINLRGVIVPILDLRARFGMAPTVPTAMHVVVIIQTGTRTAGLLVDAVSDIIAVAPEEIRPVPEIGTGAPEQLLCGLVPREHGMVALVSLTNLLNFSEDMVAPSAAASLHS
jgi:purine-binding chemotaxis protein CheW